MKVVIGERAWEIMQVKYSGMLQASSEQVTFGFYAVEKPLQKVYVLI